MTSWIERKYFFDYDWQTLKDHHDQLKRICKDEEELWTVFLARLKFSFPFTEGQWEAMRNKHYRELEELDDGTENQFR